MDDLVTTSIGRNPAEWTYTAAAINYPNRNPNNLTAAQWEWTRDTISQYNNQYNLIEEMNRLKDDNIAIRQQISDLEVEVRMLRRQLNDVMDSIWFKYIEWDDYSW